MVAMLELCRTVRAFDPVFAATNVDVAFVDSMVAAIKPLHSLGMLSDLKQQLPLYLAAAAAARAFDKTSVNDYTEAILGWWRAANCSSAFPAWALAARIQGVLSTVRLVC